MALREPFNKQEREEREETEGAACHVCKRMYSVEV
jgi:hypothetical protein